MMTDQERRGLGCTREGHAASVGQQSRQRLRSCEACRSSAEEDWPQHKTALLCLHPGKYRGRVTQIFPTGHRAAIRGCQAPAWCEWYAPREEGQAPG